jgi:Na+/H+-dicarboxylate symporter
MKIALHWQILIALVLGVLFGLAARFGGFEYVATDVVAVAGTIFLRALRMIIVPLIVASIVSGVTSIGSAESFGRLSLKTFGYYVATSLIAILTGLMMVNLIRPGVGAELGFTAVPEEISANVEKLGDTLLGIIPTNPLAAMVRGDMLPTIFFSLLFGFFYHANARSVQDIAVQLVPGRFRSHDASYAFHHAVYPDRRVCTHRQNYRGNRP